MGLAEFQPIDQQLLACSERFMFSLPCSDPILQFLIPYTSAAERAPQTRGHWLAGPRDAQQAGSKAESDASRRASC